jgi:hypothetical protein
MAPDSSSALSRRWQGDRQAHAFGQFGYRQAPVILQFGKDLSIGWSMWEESSSGGWMGNIRKKIPGRYP